MTNNVVSYEGVTYYTLHSNGCKNCIGLEKSDLCNKLAERFFCGKNQIIFVKKTKEKTYTVDDFVKAIDLYIGPGNLSKDKIQLLLDKVTDEEYDTYIRLKEKFK